MFDALTAVDGHAHMLRRAAPLIAQRHSAPARDATVGEYLGLLDVHGISHGVLTAPSFYGSDNSLLLEALAAYPQRLRGTVIVDPDVSPETLAAFKAAGVVGVRCNWLRRESVPDVTSAVYQALLQRVRDAGLHLELYAEGARLAYLVPAIRASGVRLVLDHFGSPDPKDGVRCAGFQEALKGMRAGDTFMKLTGPYRLGGADPRAYVDALLEAAPRQVVWGSDWPFVSHESEATFALTLEWLHAWIPDVATRTMVLRDNAARLFGLQH